MALNGLEGEELVNHLKHLILGFEPHIREAGSAEQVEETLLHLEENEEKFHRFEFVKRLKKSIDENLGYIIDEEIERCSMSDSEQNGQEPRVSRITQRVISSSQTDSLVKKLRRSVTEATDELLQNFDQEFGSVLQRRENDLQMGRNKRYLFDDEDDQTSYISSLNQPGSLMFMNSERFIQVTENLHKSRSNEVRQEALHQLNMAPTIDVVSSDYWPVVRKSLLDLLGHSDEALSAVSLKFVVQAFSTTTPRTSEIYCLLVESLISKFTSTTASIPKLKNGLDARQIGTTRILKAFRLMNEFQKEAPAYWVRYPDKFLKEVLESTLNLLSIQPLMEVSPLHLIAVIDPKAGWFIKWMHGSYSRTPLLCMLERYKPIVDSAVGHSIQYSLCRKSPYDTMSESSEIISKSTHYDGQRMFYSGPELEYAYFVHSIHLLGRLLSYTNGRRFFPVTLPGRDEAVSITKLLVSLIHVITDPGTSTITSKPDTEDYEPAEQVTEMLKVLCNSEQVCEICLCKDDVTDALIKPLRQWLDNSEYSGQVASEGTLLKVADILCVIASSTRGRRHLLYGQQRNMFSRNKSSAAHSITEFTKTALVGELSSEFALAPSKAVIGDFLYICRQLYNTSEGLLVLNPYSFHTCVANALEEVSRETVTPTPDQSADLTPRTSMVNQSISQWEDTLRDNLLNFASTAKGILLLQQTGAINECVSYMYARYAKKLQVSKCEKFGYGYMVTQVAATAPGMVALQNTDSCFIRALIDELWSVLECGASDYPVFTPKVWPVDAIDRQSHKPMIRLLNVLSAFPAVYEVLADQPIAARESYGLRQIPDTIAALIDRLIIVNSPAKIHSLFNYEQSHVFGLRVLSVMMSCLDTYLLLQSQYEFQDVLLSCQGDNNPEPRIYSEDTRHSKHSNEVIVDMLSVERNYILVKSYLVGGPSERVIPPRTLLQGKDNLYPFPLFSSYPVPREYTPNLASRSPMKQAFAPSKQIDTEDNDLSKLLAENKKKPDRNSQAWLEKCKTMVYDVLSVKPELIKGNAIQYLLEQSLNALVQDPQVATFPQMEFSANEKAVRSFKLTPLQQLGVKVAVRYGVHMKLFSSSPEGTNSLSQLIKLCSTFLQQQQKVIDSSFRFLSNSYPGFDWFAATIFLIFNGSLDRSWKFLYKFSTLASSGYLWAPRLHASVHLPPGLMSSGIPPVFSSTGHNIELILQTEHPLIASAFKMSGYTPAQICVHWLRQCFWNYLDWLDICHYICIAMVMGVDYQVYICVAILCHLENDIMQHLQNQDLVIFLKEEPIRNFRLGSHLPFMRTLEEKFRRIILPDMLNFSKP